MDIKDITSYKVNNGPPTAYYIPNFITPEEEEHILKHVYSVPRPKWTVLLKRRLQDYGGVPHEKGMIAETIPAWLQTYLQKVNRLNIFSGNPPNQVLVNEYEPGQGIMPHTDGPLFHPVIATISCGTHTVLEFTENTESRRKVCDLLLERYSLVVIKDDLYSKYLHSINDREIDLISENCVNLPQCGKKYSHDEILKRSTRVSVTIRNVPKVLKIKLF